MIYKACSGRFSGGEAVGILLLETAVPFIPGDVANASTYAFPVRFQNVPGFTVERAIGKDMSVFESLQSAALDLAGQGVRAVTGDCGFMAVHQAKLADRLDIPVFLSSLLQIPFISGILGSAAKVGVITADSRSLDADLLQEMGVHDMDRIVIGGLEEHPNFYSFAIEESGVLNSGAVEQEVIETAQHMVRTHPAVRAILLECSLLPPYAAAVQEAVNLPVFDYVTMIQYVYSSVVRRRFSGFM